MPYWPLLLRRVFTVLIVNIAVLCGLAEVAGLLVHYFRTGRLFYLSRPVYEQIPETAAGQLTADGLNPYFGPSHKPGHPFEIPPELRPPGAAAQRLVTNNFGFVSPYNYPTVRTHDDQFFVAILGGSVGVWFCHVGGPRLFADLQRLEFFKRRTLVPLCLAHEGYKQPQQLLVLAYFLSTGQPLDLVINIDGFNEVALSPLNAQRGYDISMPSASHLDPLINLVDQATLTPEKLQTLAAIARDKQRLNGLAGTLQRNRLAVVDFVLGRYQLVIRNRYENGLRAFAALPSNPSANSIVNAIPATEQRDAATLYADIARNWAQASLLMRATALAHGAAFVHVLQPNQYRTARVFSPDEARVALDPRSPFKPGVEHGYPALVAEARSRGLAGDTGFFDATALFDAEPAAVYIDNCCHYTRVGYERLADFIARAVATVEGPWLKEDGR